ncbi:MAG: M18 family aminopeptidase [Fibrobacter sp.]|nr:M18 family aminopeptidase [Fibrobacter sp.]
MDFFEFLNYAVTPYHTVDFLKKALSVEEVALMERGGALIAARMPRKCSSQSRFRIALAHTDFPALKISPNPDKGGAGVCTLHSEIYGSPLFTSWLDRDLGYAGLLAIEKDGRLESRLVRGDRLFRIPQLAIHLNRNVNQEGLKVNPQTDLDALWCAASGCASAKDAGAKFVDALQAELLEGERLLDFDIQLFDAQGANAGGFNGEWIYSGRLDNLSSCHAIAQGILQAKPDENDFLIAAFMNNEEVGSNTREGAAGNFLKSSLETLWKTSWPEDGADFEQALSQSLALSIDMAHAAHPNFVQKHEANHAPVLGGGIVLKTNAQKRYASDVMSSARFKLLCEQANVIHQTFITRNDMPCGSTVGPTVSAALGIPTVDVGEPMLSMHSIREMIALKDHQDMVTLLKVFMGG